METPPEEARAPSSPSSPRRRVRALAWLTLALCVGTVGLLATLATTSAPWAATNELRQSVHFLQQWPPSLRRPAAYLHKTHADKGANTTEKTARGVVLCLHDGIVSMGVSLIRELRCLGNTERIQVYHCFPDELSEASRALLTRGDDQVELVDVCSALLHDPTVFNGDQAKADAFRGYWIKPLALVHTDLDEVILLDADAILMTDPATLRAASSGYARTGTVFFHDRITFMRKFFNAQLASGEQLLHHIVATFDYAKFGLAGPRPSPYLQSTFAYKEQTGHEMDSSMVLVDKRRTGKALEVLLHLLLDVRFQYTFSWGDKEAFWLAYELAQQDYFFSPWGLSLIDSVPNDDLVEHPDTLCGSMAHFVPTEDAADAAELLYVNGKVLLNPFAVGLAKLETVQRSRLFNVNPTKVTPRYNYSQFDVTTRKTFECNDDQGATPLPDDFRVKLLRRRHHYFAAETGVFEALDKCGV